MIIMRGDKMNYTSEEEFLKHYDATQFDQLSMTTDILIFSISDGEQENYRKLRKKYFSVLLLKRNQYPFKDKWCLPGSFLRIDETLEEASKRVLFTKTNLQHIYLEQLYTFSSLKRDPRTRVVSTAYMSLVDKNRLTDKLDPDASWFHVNVLESDNEALVLLDNGTEQLKFRVQKELANVTTKQYHYQIQDNQDLAFDHAEVLYTGIERLKNKIEYTDIVFHMMPEYFTLGELQQVYEVILDKKLLDPAFRRMIASKVEKTKRVKTGGGHRPSALFRYKGK